MENLQQKYKDPVDLKGTKAALNAIAQQLLGVGLDELVFCGLVFLQLR